MDHFIFRYSGHFINTYYHSWIKGKMLRKYNAVLTLVMIAIIFSDKPKQAMMLMHLLFGNMSLLKAT